MSDAYLKYRARKFDILGIDCLFFFSFSFFIEVFFHADLKYAIRLWQSQLANEL